MSSNRIDLSFETVKQALKEGKSMRGAARLLKVDRAVVERVLRDQKIAEMPGSTQPARDQRDRARAEAHRKELEKKLLEREDAESIFTHLHHVPEIRVAPRKAGAKRIATPVTFASDWHFGETVTLEETMGLNEYNLAIARARAAKFWDNVMWLRGDMQRTTTCHDHVLWLGGDLISGNIHPELVETNEAGLVEQISQVAAAIRPGIDALAKDARKLIVACSSGNHGRITAKSQIKTGWANSLETLLYRFLRDSCKHSNIEWHIPRAENLRLKIHGYTIQLQHGTQVRSQGGIGGILVPLTRFAARSDSAGAADYYGFGHFHQAHWFDKIIVNGSLIGDSAYSRANGMSFRAPEQVNFQIDERRGLRRFEPVSVT